MNNIFIAFIFIIFDISFDIGNHSIGLTPAFLGYWFLGKGLVDLHGKSALCAKMIPWAKGMMIFTGVIYVLDLLGLSAQLALVGTIIESVGLVLMFYVTNRVVAGIQEVENYHHADILVAKLKSSWMYMVILSVAGLVLSWIPIVNLIAMLLALVFDILFVVAMHNTNKAYNALPPTVTYNTGDAI